MKTYQPLSDLRPYQIRDGIAARAVNGERMTLAVVDLDPNAVLAEHRHPNEQMGFIISGSMTMRIGGDSRELRAGDTYVIPGDTPHDAVTGPDGCTAVDVFAPVRADWEKLPRLEPSAGRWP